MNEDYSKYYNSDQEAIRGILGKPDDYIDPELYQIRFVDDGKNNLRMLYNMRVKAQRERARLQAKGILDSKGFLVDQTLTSDMKPGSQCTIQTPNV